MQHYTTALALGSDHLTIILLYNRSYAYLRLAKYHHVIDDCNKLLSFPVDIQYLENILYRKGASLARLEKYPEATSVLETLRSIIPNCEKVSFIKYLFIIILSL